MVECTSTSSLKLFWKSCWFKKFKKHHPSDWLVNERVWREKMWEAHFRRQFDNRHPYLRPSSGMIKKLFNLVVEGIKQHLVKFDEKTATIKGANHAPCWRLCWFCFPTARIKNGVRKKAQDTYFSLYNHKLYKEL